MRIISCKIYNFGRLSDIEMDFNESVNTIVRENGWGKSTFSAFIRIMLYGFSGERARNDTDNERKRYRPWNHGLYGGSIRISTSRNEYVVKKIFGEKEKDDEIQIINIHTGKMIENIQGSMGKYLLEIDEESYKRTAFITSADTTTGESDDINAKLGNLVDDTKDVNRYEDICRLLQDYLNKMSPVRKTGYLYKMKKEKMSLEKELLAGYEIEKKINDIGENIIRLRKEDRELLNRLESMKQEKINADNNIKSSGYGDIIKIFVLIISAAVCIYLKQYIPGIACLCISFILQIINFNKNKNKDYVSKTEELDNKRDAVNERLQKVRADMIYAQTEINELRKELSGIDEVSRRFDDMKKEYEKYFKEYQIAEKTRNYIIKAKENLSSGYVVPVLKSFKKYLKYFDSMHCQIDINMNINFEESGMLRDAAFLSEGYRDIVNICLRMALIDVMYEGEAPFIVMDDVFVHLDDEKIKEAGRFMERLSEKYQLLYFTARKNEWMN